VQNVATPPPVIIENQVTFSGEPPPVRKSFFKRYWMYGFASLVVLTFGGLFLMLSGSKEEETITLESAPPESNSGTASE
jgi:hypothetical protein